MARLAVKLLLLDDDDRMLLIHAKDPKTQAEFAELGVDLHLVSAPTHEGLSSLMQSLAEKLSV